MAKRKKRRDTRNRHAASKTPAEDLDCWVEWGGEMIWAVGFTSGGAPFGLTQAEYMTCMGESEPERNQEEIGDEELPF